MVPLITLNMTWEDYTDVYAALHFSANRLDSEDYQRSNILRGLAEALKEQAREQQDAH